MDPALQELIGEGSPDDEVALVVRLNPGVKPPFELRVVARFGEIATVRVPRGVVSRLYGHPAIASIKAPRTYSAELEEICDEADVDLLTTDQRRPAGLQETGRGVTIAVLDWGCDFTHDDFCHADGTTRIKALWDQRGTDPQSPYGYGHVHQKAKIDSALISVNPFAALGYQFANAPQHGTHVLGIAAGNGRGGGPMGIAPEADIVFCHLGTSDRDLGNSIELLEALDFAVKAAGEGPLVVNMSVGRHAGPHDSSLLVEKAIDWILVNRPGTAIAQSAGNYHESRCHMSGRLHETIQVDLPIEITRRSTDNIVVETWYPSADEFGASLSGPDGIVASVKRGGKIPIKRQDGMQVGMLYHRAHDPNNGDHLIDLVLRPDAPRGEWVLHLTGIDVVDGRWHSWIERDTSNPKAQARFRDSAASQTSTTGSICNALRTIAVGAHDAHSDQHNLGKFSSVGPTRDGRVKPLLTAPGVKTLSCRSAGGKDTQSYVRMSGTSMASPHVAGTLALMLQAAGQQPVAVIRRALFATLDTTDLSNPRNGYGRLSIDRAVLAARALKMQPQREASAEDFTNHLVKGNTSMHNTRTLAPSLSRNSGGQTVVERALDPGDDNVRLIGWGGRKLSEGLEHGDIILNRNGEMMAMAAGSNLLSFQEATESGLVTEGPWPGRYVQLLTPDGQASPFARRVMSPDGLLLPDLVIARPVLTQSNYEGRGAEYSEAVEAEMRPKLRLGSQGPFVLEAQTKLNTVHSHFMATGPGINNCPLTLDSHFGSLTKGAVISFQRRVFPGEQREWDGVIGPRTWAKLDENAARGDDRPPNTPPSLNIPPLLNIPPSFYVPPIVPVSATTTVVPVIVLPGVMGTRLKFPTTKRQGLFGTTDMLDWDPNSSMTMLQWAMLSGDEKLAALNFRTRADIIRDTSDTKGWSSLHDETYQILLSTLERDLAFGASPCADSLGFNPTHSPVFGFGYDWRRSCASHASRLNAFIDAVLERTRAEKVILVTHSMGGLVARAAMPVIAAKVLGVVHTVQPAVGAVTAYRRFITGYTPKIDKQLGEHFLQLAESGEAIPEYWALGEALSDEARNEPIEEGAVATKILTAIFSDGMSANPVYYGRLMSVLPGAVELMPSNAAGVANPTWLRPHVPPSPIDIYDVYKKLPFGIGGGVVNPGLPAADRAELLLRLDEANAFHRSLGYHQTTGVLAGKGKKSEIAIDPSTGPTPVITRDGDGTVPEFSALCPDLAAPIFRVSVANVNHGQCFHNATFLQTVVSGVDHILRGKSPLRGSVPPNRSECLMIA